jgi:hypothetical protein
MAAIDAERWLEARHHEAQAAETAAAAAAAARARSGVA